MCRPWRRSPIGAEWTKFTAEQKEKLLEVFDEYMVTTYAARFKNYKSQKFEVGEVKEPSENRKLVETRLIRSNGEPIALNYLFRPDGGRRLEDHRRLSERRDLRDGAHAFGLLRPP